MQTETETAGHIERKEAKARIKAALKEITGKRWSVTFDRGTAAGWIKIHALPSNRVDEFTMSEEDQEILKDALGLDRWNVAGGFALDPRCRAGFVRRLEARAEKAA